MIKTNNFSLRSISKNIYLYLALILVSSVAISAPLEFSGNFELDVDAGKTSDSSTVYNENGFLELNAFSKHTRGNYFAAVKGSVRFTLDGDIPDSTNARLVEGGDNVVVRDAYIQFGSSVWDLQFGRFEAIDLFPLGKDTLIVDIDTTAVYKANLARGFVGNDGGQIALHVKATESLHFELDTIFGDDDAGGDDETAFSGVRPSVTYGDDNFKVTLGMESIQYDLTIGGEVDQTGVALSSSFKLGSVAINIAAASLDDDSTLSTVDDITSYTANFAVGGFGAGIIFSELNNSDEMTDTEVTKFYAAYTLPLLGIDGADVTFAGSYADSDNVAVNDTSTAFRVRFNYAF